MGKRKRERERGLAATGATAAAAAKSKRELGGPGDRDVAEDQPTVIDSARSQQ